LSKPSSSSKPAPSSKPAASGRPAATDRPVAKGAPVRPESTSSKPASKVPESPTPKKQKKAKEVADAFASGKVTLGNALGLTQAQKDVMKRRAFALVQESKPDLAIPILEGLVALDPFDAWVLVALGGLLVDRNDHAVAEALLTRALAVTPGDAVAHAMRAEARVKQGNTDGAREDLKAIAQADLSIPAVRRAKALEIALSKL
jgi:predicted Zn-dependent protease